MVPNFVKTLKRLANQEARLQAEKQAARQEAIETVNQLISIFSLKAADLTFGVAAPVQKSTIQKIKPVKQRRKAAPKYRVADGRTWTGRGKMPLFIRDALNAGSTLEDLLIK